VLGSLSARERRTVTLGAIVSVVALATTFGVIPFARRWSAREEAIAAGRDRLARLEGLARHQREIGEAVRARDERLAGSGQRLLAGRTPALAASALQTLLQGYADRSHVTISRLDVAGAPDSTASAQGAIPATISAVGDIYGVSELLWQVRYGPRMLEVREMSVVSNSALRGGLLQLSLTVHAPYVPE
jgi:hypothetical protein